MTDVPDEVLEFLDGITWTEQCPDELMLPGVPPLEFDDVVGLRFGDYWEAWDISVRDVLSGTDEDEYPMATVVGCDRQDDYWFAASLPEGCDSTHLLVPFNDEIHWVSVSELTLPTELRRHFEELVDDVVASVAPAMSVFWPVARDLAEEVRQDWAMKIRQLPLVPMEVGTVSGFGMTGGGMDMTYWIAEAYVRCGYQPPQELGELPWSPESQTERMVGLAVWKTQRARMVQAEGRAERLEPKLRITDAERARLLPS